MTDGLKFYVVSCGGVVVCFTHNLATWVILNKHMTINYGDDEIQEKPGKNRSAGTYRLQDLLIIYRYSQVRRHN